MSNPTLNQATHTLKIIGDRNPTLQHITTLHDGYLADLVEAIMKGSVQSREEFRKANGLTPLIGEQVEVPVALQPTETPTTGILRIDYGLNHEQMITAGNYDWKNDNLTAKRFPVVGQGIEEVEYKLFNFGRDISSEAADKAITEDDKANPWQSAGTEHILAFGAQNSEAQRKNPIVALKAIGKVLGVRHVVCLLRGDVKRNLDLCSWDGVWGVYCRFLAVRKLKKSVT